MNILSDPVRSGTAEAETQEDANEPTLVIRDRVVSTSSGVEPSSLPPTDLQPNDYTSNWQQTLVLTSMGRMAAALLSVAALSIAVALTASWPGWLWQSALLLILIRYAYCTTRGPQPILDTRKIRRQFRRMLVDEAKIILLFIAACWVGSISISRETMAIFAVANVSLQLLHLGATRQLLSSLRQKENRNDRTLPKQVLIVGSGRHAKAVADMLLDSPELETGVVGFLDFNSTGLWRYRDIPLVGQPDQLNEIVEATQVDAIFLAVEPADIERSRPLFQLAETMGVALFVMPELYMPNIARPSPTYVNGLPAFLYRSTPSNTAALFLKGVIDRTVAGLAIVALSPIMIAAALTVRLTSPGPILFRQTRVGRNGRLFPMFKFRSMYADAEARKASLAASNEMNGPMFKIKADPRITPIGRFIRKYSIDELPQLFNVLFGQMSLVGPRPALPKEVRQFEPWQRRKLSVKPGLTCIWQVSGRNSIPFEQWMELDLQYIDRWSLWLDFTLLARTIPTVLKGSGV